MQADGVETLGEVLERFNRKERNLLIRDILGDEAKPPRLSGQFRERLTKKLGLLSEIPEDAWWATDYHIDWLAGALLTYMNGDPAHPEQILDLVMDNKFDFVKGKKSDLVMGNQEDIDLVVAAGDDLILVEVKAYGYFGTEQVTRKLKRLALLYKFYKDLEKDSDCNVQFHLLLYSNKPTTLTEEPWPWPCNHPDRWMKLELPGPDLAVTRWDKSEGRTAEGKSWRCFKIDPVGGDS
jgi:hypothetical protein